MAVYFCEDSRKYKLEELLKCLFSFITDFKRAREVIIISVYLVLHTHAPLLQYMTLFFRLTQTNDVKSC